MRLATATCVLFAVTCLASGSTEDGSNDTSVGNAQPAAPVMVLSAGQLGSQLLSTTGIDDDTPVEVFSSYAAAQPQLSFALRPDATPGANAFASVLIAPKLQQNLPNDPDAAGGFSTFDLDDADALGPRTQLYYNCTATHRITDLLQDANVASLVSFQLTTTTNSSSDTEETNASNVSASATLQLHDCKQLGNVSVGQILTRNAFFGDDVAAAKWPFRVISSHVVSRSTADNSAACVVAVELVQATLKDVYPNCHIKFSSTDVSALVQAADPTPVNATNTTEKTAHHEATRRRLGANSFEFLKHPLCFYACGAVTGDEVDECRTAANEKLTCSIQFYEPIGDCFTECGDDGLRPNQCFSAKDWSFYYSGKTCAEGYQIQIGAVATYCTRVLSCRPVSEASVSTPRSMAWNLDTNDRIIAREIRFFESGDCSDPTDPRSDCCRITCEDCYVDVTMTSIYVDADVAAKTTDTRTKVVGNSSLTFAIYAPNGCFFESKEEVLVPEISRSFPLGGTGFTLDLSVEISRRFGFELKPRGSLAKFGWMTHVHAVTGNVKEKGFRDLVLNTTPNLGIGSSAIDIAAEYVVIPTVKGLISFVGLVGIGVQLEWETYGRLDASVSFPDPLPARALVAYNPASQRHYGDCTRPHFMAFEGTAGARDYTTSVIIDAGEAGDYPIVEFGDLSAYTKSRSVFSGCATTAYEATMLLTTAMREAQFVSDTETSKLTKLLTWALRIPAIEAAAIRIASVSGTNGSIAITLAVPPAVAELYPQASDLLARLYELARRPEFRAFMSAEVGLQIASACDDGWWGATCSSACDSSIASVHCRVPSCNAVDGTFLSCRACKAGFHGPNCEQSCNEAEMCAQDSTVCDRSDGTFQSCEQCRYGYWGVSCTSTCPGSSRCVSPSCRQADGTTERCASCTDGYWGPACEASCVDDGVHRCADGAMVCTQDSGAYTSCSACRSGHWSSDCSTACANPLSNCAVPTCSRWDGEFESCEQCNVGFWGASCEHTCPAGDAHGCADGAQTFCDQTTGTFTSCSACPGGYWRANCAETCPNDTACVSPTCTQYGGEPTSCKSCRTGFYGVTCKTPCVDDSTRHCASEAAVCDVSTGQTTACSACTKGYWGPDCASTCTLPAHCASVVCAQTSGVAESCPVCEEGYKGAMCDEKVAKTGSSASPKSVAAFAMQLVLAAVVTAVALSLR